MASIKKQREAMIASGGLDQNALLGSSHNGRRAKWLVSSDIPAAMDAVLLCETVADAVLDAHRTAIEAGERPDGSGPQPALDPGGASGREATRGDRPNLRGVRRGRAFVRGLERTPVKFSGSKLTSGRRGTRAKTTIRAGVLNRGWVKDEADKGISYFSAEGTIAELVQRTLLAWADAELIAKVPMQGPRERRAPMQGPKLPPMQGPRQQKSK
jgi:hypothetical protein